MTDWKIEAREYRRRTWIEGDEEKRAFYSRVWPLGDLEAIPEAATYLEHHHREDHRQDIPEDTLSV